VEPLENPGRFSSRLLHWAGPRRQARLAPGARTDPVMWLGPWSVRGILALARVDERAGQSRLPLWGSLVEGSEKEWTTTCTRRSLVTRQKGRVFARLKSAYSKGGIPAVRDAYVSAAKESLVCRTAWRLVDLVCPVTGFLDWTVRLNDLVAAYGYHGAAARLFDALPLRWESEFPPDCEEIRHNASLILYGNHPSQITSLIVAAALDRSDLRFLGISFFTKILPSAEPFVLQLQDSHRRVYRDLLGSGLAHRLALSFLFHLDEQVLRSDAREHNRGMLRSAAGHVRGGGSVLIFPMGEATGWRDWFPGIGVLVRELAETAEGHQAYLLPFHVENESNARLYSLLSTSPLGRARRKRLNRDPVRIRFGRPTRVQEIVEDPTLPPPALASLLQQQYERVFPAAKRFK